MNVRRKLLSSLIVMALVLLAVGVLVVANLFSIQDDLRILEENEIAYNLRQSKAMRLANGYLAKLAVSVATSGKDWHDEADSDQRRLENVIRAIQSSRTDQAPEVDQFVRGMTAFKTGADDFLEKSKQNPGFEGAAQAVEGLSSQLYKLEGVTEQKNPISAISERRVAISREIVLWIVGFSILTLAGVGYSLLMALALSRTICTPLEALTAATKRVAEGDLTVAITAPRGNDEVAQLSRSFQEMLVAQSEMVRHLKEVASHAIQATDEINEATQQQSATSSEQASAVAETTATVDQVNESFGRTSQMIQSVTDLSGRVVEVSRTGQSAVDDNVTGMAEVKEKMGSIAENILALSEKTQLIGEIISSVNDISEQSKFLALNASIEAARAGQHGKGFAVVAMEVRNLAEQSKQATTQIRDILIDIQNATNAAVMVTEEGSHRVESGTDLATQSGAVIRELAEAVAESAQAAERIAAAVREQTIGMSQITTAMSQINQAAAQNLSGIRQVEMSARNLRAEGGRLKEVVDRYVLPAE